MMLKSHQIYRLKEIAYSHQGLINNPFNYSSVLSFMSGIILACSGYTWFSVATENACMGINA